MELWGRRESHPSPPAEVVGPRPPHLAGRSTSLDGWREREGGIGMVAVRRRCRYSPPTSTSQWKTRASSASSIGSRSPRSRAKRSSPNHVTNAISTGSSPGPLRQDLPGGATSSAGCLRGWRASIGALRASPGSSCCRRAWSGCCARSSDTTRAWTCPSWGYAASWVREAMQQLVAELTRPLGRRALAKLRSAAGHSPTAQRRRLDPDGEDQSLKRPVCRAAHAGVETSSGTRRGARARPGGN